MGHWKNHEEAWNKKQNKWTRTTIQLRVFKCETKQNIKNWNEFDDPKKQVQATAFSKILYQTEECMVKKKEILKLADLRVTYVKAMEEQGFPSVDSWSEKVKNRFEQDPVMVKIKFPKADSCKGCISHILVNNHGHQHLKILNTLLSKSFPQI